MKKKIISIFLSLIICSTVVLQPKIVKADPFTNVLGGGVLFLLLTTALGHAGYQIENEDSANYIYNFFFKKYGLSEEELKAIAEKNDASMISWDDFLEKLTTPIDTNYPSLRDSFYKKTTSAGVKIGIKVTDAFKQALDQLVDDLPTSVLTEMGACDEVLTFNSLPVSLDMTFSTVNRPEDDDGTTYCVTTPYLYFEVENPTDNFINLYYSVIPSTWTNTSPFSFGQSFFSIEPNSKKVMELVSFSQPAYLKNYDYICLHPQGENTANIFACDMVGNSTHSRSFTFSIDKVSSSSLKFGDIHYCGGILSIPFNETSKDTYNDNEAIWETLGSIETTLDGLVDMPLDDSYADSLSISFPLDKEATDTWVDTKEEVQVKTKDEVKEEDQEFENIDAPEVPIDGIIDNSSKLTDKFPFCIPFDLVRSVESFQDDTYTKIEFDVPIPYSNDPLHFCLDFEQFEVVVIIFRFFSLLMFIISMLILTRNIIRG